MRKLQFCVVAVVAALSTALPMLANGAGYTPPQGALAPTPLKAGSQFSGKLAYKPGTKIRIAYMPPTTNPYYTAIGEGVKARAAELGAEVVVIAPTDQMDIAAQMKMLQDVPSQGVHAIILSTHDENAAGPLVKRLTGQGIAVVIVNSDIAAFPSPVSAVVGYNQRKTTHALGEFIAKKRNGKAVVGVLEGGPGYHSTERVGGFLDAFKKYPDMKVVASLPTAWDQETGNKATLDMLQAHPDINLIVAANDYEAIGAAAAVKSLNREQHRDLRERRRHHRAGANLRRHVDRDLEHDAVRDGQGDHAGDEGHPRRQVPRGLRRDAGDHHHQGERQAVPEPPREPVPEAFQGVLDASTSNEVRNGSGPADPSLFRSVEAGPNGTPNGIRAGTVVGRPGDLQVLPRSPGAAERLAGHPRRRGARAAG